MKEWKEIKYGLWRIIFCFLCFLFVFFMQFVPELSALQVTLQESIADNSSWNQIEQQLYHLIFSEKKSK